MARVIGGFGVSHSPSMGYEYDKGIAGKFDPRWKIWFDGMQPVKRWLADVKPDQIVIVYNDHLNHFTFDAYPTFALGVAENVRAGGRRASACAISQASPATPISAGTSPTISCATSSTSPSART